MIIACLSCFGVLIAGLGVLYGIFGEKDDTKGVILCGSLMMSILAFALTLLNFSSYMNAVAIFFPLAIMSIAIGEFIQYTHVLENVKKVLQMVFFDVALALFSVGVIVLGEFNFIGLLCGELAGLCFGLLFWAINKTQKKLEILSSVLGYLLVGMLIGGCVWNVICATHLISSILTLCGGCVILLSMILKTFGDANDKIRLIQRIVLTVALVTMALGMYFF